MPAIRRILTPVDFSEPSDAAARYAARLALSLGAELELLHVIDASDYAVFDVGGYMPPVNHGLEQGIDDRLTKLAAALSDGGPPVSHRMVRGVAYEAITVAAENGSVDMIVMGTHGHTGVKHLLLGSVSEKVVRVCKVPVLTVHQDAVEPA